MYEVEWTTEVPVDECGDADLDNGVTQQKYFRDEDAAKRFAVKVFPSDYFGAVRITECHAEPYEPGRPGTYLEYDGEPQYYEGDE